ncbi:DUF2207 domain-containing protein [uncultured Microbacterium sp.]|uniref:DUF2207 domain-containing protein n=1 Tax=uncultured Microbacterium sp. TaxID=191216 RepID=UPI0025F7BED5|nr:DUF2207 domain-containing protein [uncultured Microbacterium sp.]
MTADSDDERSAPPEATLVEPPRHTPLWAFLSRLLLRLEAWLRSHGGTRLRAGIRVFWAAVAAVGLVLLVGPVINAPLTFDDITSSAKEATSTWIAQDFSAEYDLQRHDDGRLAVAVTERFTAVFPDDVDERSIERVLASQYEGHDLAPTLREARLDDRTVDARVTTTPTRTTYVIGGGDRLTGSHRVELRYDLRDLAYDDSDTSSDQVSQLLQWDVFGPEWPHGVSSSSLRVVVPRDLEGAFARQPSAGLSWLLVSGSTTMEPEDAASDPLVYEITNDQNIPPHGSFWFTFRFDSGTFAMPGPSPLFLVQAYGPFVPLLLLAAGVLFAFAARAVAWADARGRAWFVPESQPRRGSSVALDARLWAARRTAVLAEALDAWRRDPTDSRLIRRLARAAHRAGRWGDLLPAVRSFRFSPAWRSQFQRGLRTVPRGFVRDAFLGGAFALAVLQLGLTRQLSHQRALTIEWWPAAAAAASVALAAVILTVALSARPLTREGALAREHLLGQRQYLELTNAAERTPLRSADLPYVVIFAHPRVAGRLLRDLIEREGIARGVGADPTFLGRGRLAVRACALGLVAGAVALAFLTTASTNAAPDQAAVLDGIEGSSGLAVTDADIAATLSRDGDGAGRVEVVETLKTEVEADRRVVPQVTRAWRDVVDGRDQGLTVESITVDGRTVPFVQTRRLDHAVVQTRLTDDWSGAHVVEIRYEVARPIAEDASGERLTWTALLPGWSWSWRTVDAETEHVRIALTLADGLGEGLEDGSGWMDATPYRPDAMPEPLNDDAVRSGSETVVSFDARASDEYSPNSRWPSSSKYAGLDLRFAPGTFSSATPPSIGHTLWTALPWLLGPILGAAAVVLGLGGMRARDRVGVRRDLARWVPPSLVIAQVVLVGWAAGDAATEDAILPVVLIPVVLSAVVAAVAFVRTRRLAIVTRT